ncbi:FAD-binding oxidoreductase [Amycolatopsis circi]|uniref:FAD-binding oxidoreductase n=1 Tax=Amycolatopsis circi TaxID=871959 RepID=UPI000E2738E4|nr:FAD-binding protein [Amycolatopsis circi]
MTGVPGTTSRRKVLLAGTAAAGAAVLPGTAAASSAARPAEAIRIHPGAPQYADLARGVNQRWIGSPDEIVVAQSAADVAAAVDTALQRRARLAVRSGGHCFEDFTTDGIRLLVDVGALDEVTYDKEMRAFSLGAGARLGDVYAKLFKGWGVTIPGGTCPTVGAGGHISGGGYGPLNRLHGLTVDHLHAIEVVVADRGRARTVVATREPADPHRDLWWAHTGGGGGNFGVVTRYWFRDPAGSLPTPPAELAVASFTWPWTRLDERSFARLVANFGDYFARSNAAGSPSADVYAHLATFHSSGGAVVVNVQLDAAREPERRLDEFAAAIGTGVGFAPENPTRTRLPWLLATQWPGFADRPNGKRIKGKSAMHRRPLSAAACSSLYRHLTRADYRHPGSGVLHAPYGGRVNAVPADATASVHRDCALTLLYVSEWTDPAEDAKHLSFQRDLYRDVYADTGGVPAPGADTAGTYVNYPDADLLDPAFNTSGIPWTTLYYGDAYPRLQRIKHRWDPDGVFGHRLGVRGTP